MTKKLSTTLLILAILALAAALLISSNINRAAAAPGFSVASSEATRGTEGNGFSYQGKLYLNGQPADGDFDMTFTLHDRLDDTATIGTVDKTVTVRNGLFHTYLNFGDALLCFHHVDLFLQVQVEDTTITPRHFLSRGPQDVKYETTIIVSPVYRGENQLDPLASGERLLKAIKCTSDGRHTASGDRPILIKVEPGVYDLGNRSLRLQPFTDLEGSGEKITYITSDIPSPDPRDATTDAAAADIRATVIGASFTEVRELSIVNRNDELTDGTYSLAMYNHNIAPDQMRISNVTLSASASPDVPTRFVAGIFNHRASPRLDDVTINMYGGSFAVGMANYAGSSPYTTHMTIRSSGANNTNFGILNVGAQLALHDSVVAVSGAASDRNVGIENLNSNVYAQDVWILASGAANENIGMSFLSNDDTQPITGYVVDARIIAQFEVVDVDSVTHDPVGVLPPFVDVGEIDAEPVPTPSGTAVGFYSNTGNVMEFNHVEIAGRTYSIVALDQVRPSVLVGASKLRINRAGDSVLGSSVRCVNVHDQLFATDYGNDCPQIEVPVTQ